MTDSTTETAKEGDYEVGYRKPPKSGQIKPGEVRNPNGRRGKPRSRAINVAEVLSEPVVIVKAGVERKVHPFEAGVRALVTSALKKKNVDAALDFIKLCEEYEIVATPPIPQYGGGVLQVPSSWDWDEWMDMFQRHGPPPWPGERSGMPENSWEKLNEAERAAIRSRSHGSNDNSPAGSAPQKRKEPKLSRSNPITSSKEQTALGRPLSARARKTIVQAIADEKHSATMGGKQVQRSTSELILMSIRMRAAEGHRKGLRALHQLLSRYGPQDPMKIGGCLIVPEPPSNVEEYNTELARQQAKYRGNDGG